MNIRSSMVYLECLMINEFDPSFLQVDYQQGLIYLFVVCDNFKYYSISERINSIFSLLRYDCPDILKEHPIIVEAFDNSELDEMMRNVKQITQR